MEIHVTEHGWIYGNKYVQDTMHQSQSTFICWIVKYRLRVVPQFSSGIVERAKRVSPFLAWGDFHARSRFARSTIPEEKWGTTRSLYAKITYSLF